MRGLDAWPGDDFGDPEQEDFAEADDGPRCRVCGCSDDNACEGGCVWATPDLCSRCV
jgi:hypothetical protein